MIQAAAMTLAVTLALTLPARADEDRAVRTKAPVIYPTAARRMGVEGVVQVEATVDADGKVKDVKALSGSAILIPAAEDAVRKWTFEPGNGIVKVRVGVTFSMRQ
jgi:TonB family protein